MDYASFALQNWVLLIYFVSMFLLFFPWKLCITPKSVEIKGMNGRKYITCKYKPSIIVQTKAATGGVQ